MKSAPFLCNSRVNPFPAQDKQECLWHMPISTPGGDSRMILSSEVCFLGGQIRLVRMSQLSFNLQPDRRSLTVTELTSRIRDLLSKNFTDILVEGEISNCREAQSGHFYFTLKDEK